MYGRETRPGGTGIYGLPWDEISVVSLSAIELAPGGARRVHLTVDVIWGESFEVHEDAEGFASAVCELCRLSGLPRPDPAALPPVAGYMIWSAPPPGFA